MDAIRGVRTSAPAPGQATISAEQLVENEALKKEKQAGQGAQAVVEVGGEQMVISAEEYAELELLRAKMVVMKAAFASWGIRALAACGAAAQLRDDKLE